MLRELRMALETLADRIRNLESNERSEVTGAVEPLAFASLPTPGQAARLLFVTDGRKTGQTAGNGTGVLAYDDGVAWRRVDDGTTVAA